MSPTEFLAAFIPQLLATVAGAAIALYGTWLAFRWQRTASSRDAVDQAAESLLVQIAEHVTAIDDHRLSLEDARRSRAGRPPRPHPAKVSIAIEVLRIRSRGDDRLVVDEISRAWDLVAGASLDVVGRGCAFLAEATSLWRSGGWGEVVRDRLESARQISLAPGEFEISADDD